MLDLALCRTTMLGLLSLLFLDSLTQLQMDAVRSARSFQAGSAKLERLIGQTTVMRSVEMELIGDITSAMMDFLSLGMAVLHPARLKEAIDVMEEQ
jgi:hypothetical protein